MQATQRIQYHGCEGYLHYIESVTPRAMPNTDFSSSIHPSDVEIYHFAEGDLFFTYEDKRIAVEQGSILVLANNVHHRPILQSPCRYVRRHVMVHRTAFSRFDTKASDLYRRIAQRKLIQIDPKTVEDEGLLTHFHRIRHALEEGSAYGELCAAVSALALLIRAVSVEDTVTPPVHRPYTERVAKIMKYVNEHLDEKLTYEALSAVFFCHEKTLSHLFQKETGIPLAKYVTERRIRKAREVLSGGGSSKDAALAAGYEDYTVFYRAFVREVGMTPSAYRRERCEPAGERR